ncbi:hypothetical protein ACIQU5_27895 [Streptomyces sp. NPDC090306]|uniref:hypothetical protein n=1 Tax=Streptomyces sp. NPDC090306 TaxID=3365961 RepID=UPI003804C1B7
MTASLVTARLVPAPAPVPPGLWRAFARDAVLNPEEKAARDQALAELRTEHRRTPEQVVAGYRDAMRKAGWHIEAETSDHRARLEARRRDGADINLMVTHVRDRGVNTYVLPAARLGKPPVWLAVNKTDFAHAVHHRALPHAYSGTPVFSKCRCGKFRAPNEFWALQALLRTRIRRHLKHQEKRRERRVYRCEADDRVWHLTSKPSWKGGTPGWGVWAPTPEPPQATGPAPGRQVSDPNSRTRGDHA